MTPREPQVRSKNEANVALDDLRAAIRALPSGRYSMLGDLDAALAWERRRTVELLRERLWFLNEVQQAKADEAYNAICDQPIGPAFHWTGEGNAIGLPPDRAIPHRERAER